MSFFSTRGGACVTASQAILYGLASDGGLYVPAMFPPISSRKLAELTAMDYRQRASAILRVYLEDFSLAEIDAAVAAAYATPKFDDEAIAPVKELDDSTFVLELFHGPTLAFKDMALQLLPHLTTLSARKNGEEREVSILVATSGDTGKAALEGFKDVPGTSCTVFFPTDGVSDVQKLQMTTTGGDNTHVIAINGNFDDAQTGVKNLFSSEEFKAKVDARGKVLSSANSINFGRLAPQIVYYFSAYADLLAQGKIKMGDKINFSVPTGNFGDILAGYLAKKSGLPVDKLICASNENNVLTDFLTTGVYDRNRKFHLTDSPSMDILISSNLERLLFLLTDGNDIVVRNWMDQLKKHGKYDVGPNVLAKLKEEGFVGYWCNDDQTEVTVHDTWFAKGYLCDTHTGVAVNALEQYTKETGDETPCVVVSTASPFKFAPAILPAMDLDFEGTDFQMLEAMEIVSCMPTPAPLKNLKNKAPRFEAVIDKEAMKQEVLDWLK